MGATMGVERTGGGSVHEIDVVQQALVKLLLETRFSVDQQRCRVEEWQDQRGVWSIQDAHQRLDTRPRRTPRERSCRLCSRVQHQLPRALKS